MGCIAVLLCFAETAFIDLPTETDAADFQAQLDRVQAILLAGVDDA